MAHPKNKRERFLKGTYKAKQRVEGEETGWTGRSNDEVTEIVNSKIKKRRDVTKPCSCTMCANPRRAFKELTLQEKKANESFSKDQSSNSTT